MKLDKYESHDIVFVMDKNKFIFFFDRDLSLLQIKILKRIVTHFINDLKIIIIYSIPDEVRYQRKLEKFQSRERNHAKYH